MAVTVLVAVPPSSTAHGGCAPTTGLQSAVSAVLRAVNIFDAVADSDVATCVDPFDQIVPVPTADWTGDVNNPNRNNNGKDRRHESAADCIDGMAADTFACSNVDLVSHVSLEELGGNGVHAIGSVNDMWGWTHPRNKKDVAIVGTTTGTAFVDISKDDKPKVLGFLPSELDHAVTWRDIKVFDDHAFIGADDSGHGIQVFDLMQLHEGQDGYRTFEPDTVYTDVGNTHNVVMNEDTGFLYGVGNGGSSSNAHGCGAGLHMIDVNNPTSPTFAGCADGVGYIHDAQCVVYEGPDPDYQGRELCFNSSSGTAGSTSPFGTNTVSVIDVTDKANPTTIFDIEYGKAVLNGYTHQNWLSEDQSTLYHGDELDEAPYRGEAEPNTVTRVFDLTDLDNPVELERFVNDTTSIDHNMYSEGDHLYQANYTTGLRVLDIADPTAIEEVAYFDVYPENDNPSFEGGSWSNYPYFRNGYVGISSRDRGLFIVDVNLP